MRYRPSRNGRTFWQSVVIGASSGICLQIALSAWREPIEASELWAIPLLIIFYGALAVPFVGIGLALFGIPLTTLLRTQAHRNWVGLIAIAWGAMAGKIVFYAIDHLLFSGYYDLTRISLGDAGILYGVPTGVAWWLLKRRALTAEFRKEYVGAEAQ